MNLAELAPPAALGPNSISSDEAKDLRWFFRWAASAFGFRAQAIEVQGAPAGKRLLPLWDEDDEHATKTVPGELATLERLPKARPAKSKQQRVSSEPERITDQNLAAVRRERRIRQGLALLSTYDYQALRLAYEGKRHSKEIHDALGDFADLAMHMPRAREAYDKYVHKFKPKKLGQQPYSLETWLVILAKHGDPLLPPLRDDVETAVGAALEAYAAQVEPPSAEELPPAPRPRPRKERGPNVEHGVPFLAHVPEDDDSEFPWPRAKGEDHGA